MEIDHIFICTETKAPVGNLLIDFGLVEGSSNVHPGQGTASRRFFFHNLMLELLWVENVEEVQNELTKPMRLYERCLGTSNNISPFGIALRPTTEKNAAPLFPVWDYHPIYLPPTIKIQVADHTPLSEPMYFYLFFATRQDKAKELEPMEHHSPLKELTHTIIHVKQDRMLSETANILNKLANLSIQQGKEHLIELEFDHGQLNQCKDFRPELPLIFKW